jgi:MYXO-CTERM domain-containing protein
MAHTHGDPRGDLRPVPCEAVASRASSPARRLRRPIRFRSLAIACAAVLCFSYPKSSDAQVQTEADPAFYAFNAAFLVQANGQAFYETDTNETSLADIQWGWGQDYDIYPAMDHYEYSHNQADLTLLNTTVNSMLTSPAWDSANNGYLVTTGDTWNDDVGWTIQLFTRAYQLTGNQDYLSQATTDWNFVMNNSNGGGWDAVNGGVWEEGTSKVSKCTLSNSNFVYTGVALYQITHNTDYLTGAEKVYAWERQYLANMTSSTITYSGPNSQFAGQQIHPGQVSDCVLADLTPQGYADWIYDNGGFLLAADELYRVTGTQSYYNDAVMVINHIVGEYNPTGNPPTPLGSSCEGPNCISDYWFTKALSEFLTLTGGWWSSPNANWLLANAQAAWNSRNSANVTWNQWGTPTNETPVFSMDMLSAAAVWSHLPTPTMNLAGTYEIQNVGSGLALDISGGSTSTGDEVIQDTFSSGQNSSLWTFVPTGGGYYQLTNVNSGLVLIVAGGASGGGGATGALIVQSPAQSMLPGNDQWLPVQNADGTFSFYNLLSRMALDTPAGSQTSGTQLDQWAGNGTPAQRFNLIQPNLTLPGIYEIQNVNSSFALNVSVGSPPESAPVIQSAFTSGETNAEWTFVAADPGYYRIQNVNSGLYVNVSGANTKMGSLLVQYPSVTAYNDQWRPVLNSDGSYSFYNALSAQAIDVPAASTTSGVQLNQWGENPTAAQKFNLINVAPGFTIAPSPASLTVMQGASSTSTISVTDQNGFAGSVTLAASGLPSGVTAAFAPSPTTGSSVFTLTASSTATTGSATVTIQGSSGTLNATTTVALTVLAETDAASPAPDGGLLDASVSSGQTNDGGGATQPSAESSGGCGCRTVPAGGAGTGGAGLASVVALLALRRRARHRSSPCRPRGVWWRR